MGRSPPAAVTQALDALGEERVRGIRAEQGGPPRGPPHGLFQNVVDGFLRQRHDGFITGVVGVKAVVSQFLF